MVADFHIKRNLLMHAYYYEFHWRFHWTALALGYEVTKRCHVEIVSVSVACLMTLSYSLSTFTHLSIFYQSSTELSSQIRLPISSISALFYRFACIIILNVLCFSFSLPEAWYPGVNSSSVGGFCNRKYKLIWIYLEGHCLWSSLAINAAVARSVWSTLKHTAGALSSSRCRFYCSFWPEVPLQMQEKIERFSCNSFCRHFFLLICTSCRGDEVSGNWWHPFMPLMMKVMLHYTVIDSHDLECANYLEQNSWETGRCGGLGSNRTDTPWGLLPCSCFFEVVWCMHIDNRLCMWMWKVFSVQV